MQVWRLATDGHVCVCKCTAPEDIRPLLQCEKPFKWLFDYLILQRPTYNVYIYFKEDGTYGTGYNIATLRILIDLDLFECAHRSYLGEGMHSHAPRGPAILFKITHETTTRVALLNYTRDELLEDWPHFYRSGPTLPYNILEKEFAHTKDAPNDLRLRVCNWDVDIIMYVINVVKQQSYAISGDRDRALGWLTAICARQLYTRKRWDTVNLATLIEKESV